MDITWYKVEVYTCYKCSRGFTYCSGSIEKRLCAVCVDEEIHALNVADRQRDRAITEYEIHLYGEDVYIFYLTQEVIYRVIGTFVHRAGD